MQLLDTMQPQLPALPAFPELPPDYRGQASVTVRHWSHARPSGQKMEMLKPCLLPIQSPFTRDASSSPFCFCDYIYYDTPLLPPPPPYVKSSLPRSPSRCCCFQVTDFGTFLYPLDPHNGSSAATLHWPPHSTLNKRNAIVVGTFPASLSKP